MPVAEMTTLARKKRFRHCLFTKNAIGKPENVHWGRVEVGSSSKPFSCHEHRDGTTVCCMDYQLHPDKVVGAVEMTNRNGDLKAHFAHMPKAVQDGYSYRGGDYTDTALASSEPATPTTENI